MGQRIILFLSVLTCFLGGCAPAATTFKGAIIPHHLYVDFLIDEFYQTLASPNIEQIILVSPNHFGYGYSYIQKSEYADFEHGIKNHLPYIEKYFPNAKILTITIKQDTPVDKLDQLIAELNSKNLKNTLVLASIDFTHNEYEEFGLQNDNRTITWLSNIPQNFTYEDIQTLTSSLGSNKNTIAMDSPETFYVFAKLMQSQKATSFELFKRTSTTTISGVDDPDLYTSHIFGILR